jgi:ABC-2 type transport system ATP-binding protein
MSLIARPSVLFLDEPTTGLDPRSRLTMWDLIDELVRGGTTTLLTTQYLEEAERLADRVVVVDHGRVIAEGTPGELKRQAGGERVELTLSQRSDIGRVRALLEGHPLVTGATAADETARTVTAAITEARGIVPAIVRLLDEAGVALDDAALRRPTLDDVFLQLTGHGVDDDESAAAAGPTKGAGR